MTPPAASNPADGDALDAAELRRAVDGLAHGQAIIADADVVRRGGSPTTVDVDRLDVGGAIVLAVMVAGRVPRTAHGRPRSAAVDTSTARTAALIGLAAAADELADALDGLGDDPGPASMLVAARMASTCAAFDVDALARIVDIVLGRLADVIMIAALILTALAVLTTAPDRADAPDPPPPRAQPPTAPIAPRAPTASGRVRA